MWLRPGQARISAAALALAIGFVFFDQAHDPGFRKGHRGWVSAHVLAVIEKATPAHGFVGYTLEFVDASGARSQYYFDRYPVFFSAGMRAVLHAFDLSMGDRIQLARQLMNAIYALTLLAGFAFLCELGVLPGVAAGAAALAGAGQHFVEYRDMVHFDQPALLGMLILCWAIARYYRERKAWLVYAAAVLAVIMGRGYASFAVLGMWWIVEAVRAVRFERSRALRRIALGPETRACLLAIAVAGSCLGYNVVTEARTRGVSIAEVGIVKSAGRRLSLDADFNAKKKKQLAWSAFGVVQAKRALESLQPYGVEIVSPRSKLLWPALLFVSLAVFAFVARRPPDVRAALIVAALSGLAWVMPMRGLTAFHEYTIMYLFGLNLVFFASLLRFVPARAQVVPAILAAACLIAATHRGNLDLERRASAGRTYTKDFERIAKRLEPGQVVRPKPSYRKLVAGVPYALGFYLPEQPILQKGDAELSITKNKHHKGKNLTPDNARVFLFRDKSKRQLATAK